MVPARLRTSCSQRIFFFPFLFVWFFFFFVSAPHFQPQLRLCKRRTSGEYFSVGLARPYSFFLLGPLYELPFSLPRGLSDTASTERNDLSRAPCVCPSPADQTCGVPLLLRFPQKETHLSPSRVASGKERGRRRAVGSHPLMELSSSWLRPTASHQQPLGVPPCSVGVPGGPHLLCPRALGAGRAEPHAAVGRSCRASSTLSAESCGHRAGCSDGVCETRSGGETLSVLR